MLILPRDGGHDHVLDESSLRLSKLRLTVYYAATHLDRSCVHLCDNELHLLCAALQFAELLGDRHHGTNGRYLDDHDLLEVGHDLLNHHGYKTNDHRGHRDLPTDDHDLDHHLGDRDLLVDDLLNHRGYKTNAHRAHRDLPTDDRDLDHHLVDRDLLVDDLLNHHDHTTDDHRDLLTDDHYLGDRDLLEDDPLNHHDHTKDDHRDLRDLLTDDHYLDDRDLLEDDPLNHHGYKTDGHRDLLTDDRDLGHHFARTQDDLLDDYLDGTDAHYDCPKDDPDCPKDGHYLDDHGLQLVCLNDHLHRRDGLDAMVCRILLPVADDVDRDFLGLALDEVYLQTTRKRRTYAICD